MTGTSVTIASAKGTSTLERAKFGPGMLLRHDDLEQLNTYTRELNRLLFRSFFGCGVVCGLVVTTEEKCDKVFVMVSSGLALGCSGDPIHVPKDLKDPKLAFDDQIADPRLWVILCGTTKCCSPRPSACADDEESSSSCTRERDGFEIRIVRELPRCVCGCPEEHPEDHESECACVDPEDPCYRDHYAGKCACNAGEDCGGCCCECIVLARLDKPVDEPWTPYHGARRFVRPVLMKDPEVVVERERSLRKREQKSALQRQQQLAKEREDQLAKEKAARVSKSTKSSK